MSWNVTLAGSPPSGFLLDGRWNVKPLRQEQQIVIDATDKQHLIWRFPSIVAASASIFEVPGKRLRPCAENESSGGRDVYQSPSAAWILK